ncbi:hypothetical protein BST61_g1103 [Cercospora zeina]
MRFTLSDNALIHPHATVMATAAQVVATRTQENAALMDAPNPTPANSSTELRGGERGVLQKNYLLHSLPPRDEDKSHAVSICGLMRAASRSAGHKIVPSIALAGVSDRLFAHFRHDRSGLFAVHLTSAPNIGP